MKASRQIIAEPARRLMCYRNLCSETDRIVFADRFSQAVERNTPTYALIQARKSSSMDRIDPARVSHKVR